MIIPLTMDVKLEGKIQLSLVSIESFKEEYEVYLKDYKFSIMTLLNINQSVNSEKIQDLSLVIRKVIEENLFPFKLIAYDDGVQLQCDQCFTKSDIQLINLSGKIIPRNHKTQFYVGKYTLKKLSKVNRILFD